ncbi:GntR family transcriptional regulator [Salinibacterium sp. UTAS2018]|uniref:GntR family transcriptional regulator n=1 Tax=Salinibacterium sp. UTAS2018 TaxID=2508880 RepID=UPI00100978D9|nr:GntR family transcriptional regulator [Salinibacterium sp. UTAS2018]QAV70479.1 GntR family transcriptional regulator [Salinibacterium sp. UTAS2018]
MLFRVDRASPLPLTQQIAQQVRSSVDAGELAPGERLPPARDLAKALQVNMHTVLRAYTELRNEGLLEMRQGRGAFIRKDALTGLSRVTELAEQLMTEARNLGMTRAEVIHLINRSEPQ